MPRINQDAILPILEDAARLADGTGGSVSSAHILLAIMRQADDHLLNLLKNYDITPSSVGRLLPEFVSEVNEYATVTNITRIASHITSLAEKQASNINHLLAAVLTVNSFSAARLVRRLGADPVFIAHEINKSEGVLMPGSRRAGQRRLANLSDERLQREQPMEPLDLPSGSLLTLLGTDLTLQAFNGDLDPVIGRSAEINRIIQILSRRKKNNPVLIGEPGVGKTAVVEGLAISIADGRNIPEALKGKRIFSLDLTGVVAGTVYRGQFEQRIRDMLSELKQNEDIIVFIDEIHMVVGAGSTQDSSMDIGNILKPALARGEIRCIGATTTSEFEKIEQDAALERRFIPVTINPSTEQDSIEILRGLVDKYAAYHSVTYSEEAIIATVKLSERFIPDRNLPDKAIDLLDESGARVHLAGGEVVTEDFIADIISEWTGIPVQTSAKEREKLRDLEKNLKSEVVGQDEAILAIVNKLQAIRDPDRPIGSFIFLGNTGVGKTYLAKRLAYHLFGTEDSVIRVDMSEFMEKHTVSKLIGSPPGYVGYEDGGKLTEQVRRKPFSVVLLDEIEKAHHDVFNILLQILDEGRITDGKGHLVNFKNTIIIMTSNIPVAAQTRIGFSNQAESTGDQIDAALRSNGFSPELINRIDSKIIFNDLNKADIARILENELLKNDVLIKEYGIVVAYSEAAKAFLIKRGFNRAYGARPLRRVIDRFIKEPLGRLLISGTLTRGDRIIVEVREEGLSFEKSD